MGPRWVVQRGIRRRGFDSRRDRHPFLPIFVPIFDPFLPIPILDGGHILLYLVEAIRRRPLSQRAREIASTIGLVCVLMLLLVGLRNDIVRFWLN